MSSTSNSIDVALIGGGIMSASLGVLLQHVRPDWDIRVFERLDAVGEESSGTWNNAGTGHAALCELNYTPQRRDGSVDIAKALVVNEQYHVSRQLWASLVDRNLVGEPSAFINAVPHMSYVTGSGDVSFLRVRYDLLSQQPLFQELEYSDSFEQIAEWLPLMTRGRDSAAPIAVTRSDQGTDVDYGELTRVLFAYLSSLGVEVGVNRQVERIEREGDGPWKLRVRATDSGEVTTCSARFVFVGAGGAALHLLQRARIPEIRGYGGFPVSGHFLHCRKPDVVRDHRAKVYGKSTLAAPPMAMPHLDRRLIDGEPGLLFGPYAGFTPKYLKAGSYLDLLKSIRLDNILTLLTVARDERALTLFLVKQIMQSANARLDVLRKFVPTAAASDWRLRSAGQRVQTMKRTASRRGVLEFGTETVISRDGTIAGVLGASPGASVAVSIMLDLMKTCFAHEYDAWVPKLQELIPSVGHRLADEPELLARVARSSSASLKLQDPA